MYLIVSLFYLQLQRIFYCIYNSRFMKFFSFNTLETWPHCLLDYFVFNKKTCVQFTFDLWEVISLLLSLSFFLCAPKIFSLCLVFINVTTNFLSFVFFVLMLLRIHWVYWIFKLIFLSYLVNFHHICSNLFYFAPICFYSFL